MAGRVGIQQAPPTLLREVADSIAIRSPAHLKQWLHASGRAFIIFDANDLVDGLPWPDGVDAMIQLCEAYRQQRCVDIAEERPCKRCGKKPVDSCPECHGYGRTIRMKSDMLEPDEMKKVVEFLMLQIRLADPNWSP